MPPQGTGIQIIGGQKVALIFEESLAIQQKVGVDMLATVKRYALPRVKAAAPPDKTGRLRRSIKVRELHNQAGEMAAIAVGPTAPHAHLITGGVKPHPIWGLEKPLAFNGKTPDRTRKGRFKKGGRRIIRWRVQHPGFAARPFVSTSVAGLEAMISADLARKFMARLPK